MLRANHLGEGSCYFNVQHRDQVAAMMLGQAYRLFKDASIIRSLTKLKRLHKESHPPDLIKLHALGMKMDMPILDAIRIGTSFEIILKAELLRRGYVIHDLKDNAAKKMQNKRPVRIEKIKRDEKIVRRKSNAVGATRAFLQEIMHAAESCAGA